MGFGRFVALGDSFTEGLADVRPDGSLRGWADLVAFRLAERNAAQGSELQYANLAVRGRKLRQIADEQVRVAEALAPDLITVGAGGNDIIRWHADVEEMGRIFDRMIERLSATGATVLAFAGFDPRRRIPLTGVPGRRADAYNGAIRQSVRRHGARLVDLWSMDRLYEDRMWAPDRLHLSTDGHALIAAAVLSGLGLPTAFEDLDHRGASVPEAGPVGRGIEHARWFVADVLPWAYRGIRGRSSGDGREPKFPAYVTIPVRSAP